MLARIFVSINSVILVEYEALYSIAIFEMLMKNAFQVSTCKP